jgi:hypothetical protein
MSQVGDRTLLQPKIGANAADGETGARGPEELAWI